MDLVQALGADRGVTCFVGAGGKKTTIYALAERIGKAVVTATVRIPPFAGQVADLVCTDDPVAAVTNRTTWPVGLVPVREGNRYLGYEPGVIDTLAAAVDVPILVKADGARSRLFKAPGADEPLIPTVANVVVPIASVKAVGRPLDEETVHRVERVSDLTGLAPGEPITATGIGRVLASPQGGRKHVPDDATVIPVINMVDDDTSEPVAREIAAAIHRRASVPHVVLASMQPPARIVAVV